ncbi:hypothetical protein ZYGM_001814 [Zygosaccharomyces mellis]|uniref:1,3-beta-glucanosyltransferase n=1 Tax=Zygosaccharomyces mellis TaxID=42258 RepID=A0A4C2E2J1_9SACH|nr:hypothetical protein ZYGM_001814 [Zygosaccharomyces mellis]
MFSLILTLMVVLSGPVRAVLPLQIQNHRFIKATSPKNDPRENEIFFIKGIDYQPGGSSGFSRYAAHDILSEPSQCARDIFAFEELGINTVRIYQLNPELNHDECMTMLNNAGIYVILDVNSGNAGEHLNRADPEGTYNAHYLSRVFKFIESFKNYPNVLGFFSGNEVINDDENYAEIDPPYLRAIQRDMKQYILRHCNRTIPVGYSAADNTALRLATFKYLQCNSWDGADVSQELDESRSDFYGLNSYQWCSGSSNWQNSGYRELAKTFHDANIPVIFSEYGCNQNSPRAFDEVSHGLYDGLKDTFSGGLVYEFSEEANSYGLVTINGEDKSLTYKKDFANLADQFSRLDLPRMKQFELPTAGANKCDVAEISAIYGNFGTEHFQIPDQLPDATLMIEHGVEDVTSGSIIGDYSDPTNLEYDVKDVNGKRVNAILKWGNDNKINEFYQSPKSFNQTSRAPVTVSPIFQGKNATSIFNSSIVTRGSSFSSIYKIGSTRDHRTTAFKDTTSSIKESKAQAAELQVQPGTIVGLFAVLLSIV